MLLTDDVYGTFVRGFRSLLGELPHNTIGVYSYSKYFGCTGWRLGVIAVHEDNLYDKMIAKLPDGELKALDKRYLPITLEPRKLKFIDRIVADSRDVALNHTAGLSLPQQVMMSLFSLYELMDTAKAYQAACMEIVHRRAKAMIEGLGIDAPTSDLYDAYYGLIDFEFWAQQEPRRGGGPVPEEEHPSARSGLPPGRAARHRAAERRRLRRARLVVTGVARQSGRRRVRRHRTRRPLDRARLPGRVRGLEEGAEVGGRCARHMRHRRPRPSVRGATPAAPRSWLGVALVILLAAGCSGQANDTRSAPAPGETRTFEGTWTASGSRRTLDLEPGHKASITSLTGSLLLTGERGLGVGFQGDAIGFSDNHGRRHGPVPCGPTSAATRSSAGCAAKRSAPVATSSARSPEAPDAGPD